MQEQNLHKLLASLYIFSLKIQNVHWNIEDKNFLSLHEYLGELYGNISGSIDVIAELIRTKNVKVKANLTTFKTLSTITEDMNELMITEESLRIILGDNYKILALLIQCYNEAEEQTSLGISNYLQDRIQEHEKIGWFLRSLIAQ